ncbi:MAG: hypothetical protein AB1546_13335 [bacterium]
MITKEAREERGKTEEVRCETIILHLSSYISHLTFHISPGLRTYFGLLAVILFFILFAYKYARLGYNKKLIFILLAAFNVAHFYNGIRWGIRI